MKKIATIIRYFVTITAIITTLGQISLFFEGDFGGLGYTIWLILAEWASVYYMYTFKRK